MTNYIYNAHVDDETNKIDFIEQIINSDEILSIERVEGVIEVTSEIIAAGFPDDETFLETWLEQDRYMIDGAIVNG